MLKQLENPMIIDDYWDNEHAGQEAPEINQQKAVDLLEEAYEKIEKTIAEPLRHEFCCSYTCPVCGIQVSLLEVLNKLDDIICSLEEL